MDDTPDLIDLLTTADPADIPALIEGLPPIVVESLLDETGTSIQVGTIPGDFIQQARELDPMFVPRDHLTYLATRIQDALEAVERGESRYIAVSMPPRAGKTTGLAMYNPLLTLRVHPDWPVMLISHDPTLATKWGRWIRRTATKHPNLGITVAPDAGAAGEWETVQGGGVLSRSIGGSIVGRGAKLMVIDDPHKGLADAHSEVSRSRVWGWWLSDAYTRLDRGGHLVIVVATRWHEDDLIGRLTSTEYEGNPTDWEVINFPAIAEDTDVLGRSPGEPLLSPQVPDETPGQALETWGKVREAVGSYAWSASYQGSPAPSKGAIFDADWWRYWTRDPRKVSRLHDDACHGGVCDCPEDGKVVLFIPEDHPEGKWLDSWDMAFKATDSSDYVVGQRWCRVDANRFLVAQTRARMPFTKTLTRVKVWSGEPLDEHELLDQLGRITPPCNEYVHRRLVEDKANGTAIIDVLKEKIPGLIPVNPTTSKEARARAVTPECESGNVLFPLPSDPGNEWVTDLLSELRSFPVGLHDDQVDGLSQALTDLRDPGISTITVPGKGSTPQIIDRRISQTALQAGRRYGQPGSGIRRAGGR